MDRLISKSVSAEELCKLFHSLSNRFANKLSFCQDPRLKSCDQDCQMIVLFWTMFRVGCIGLHGVGVNPRNPNNSYSPNNYNY
eukprot:6055674-Amphidinium_carterae.1